MDVGIVIVENMIFREGPMPSGLLSPFYPTAVGNLLLTIAIVRLPGK